MNLREQQQRIYDIEQRLIDVNETTYLLLMEALELKRRIEIEQEILGLMTFNVADIPDETDNNENAVC
jgi:hypothetical protein